MSNLLRLLLDRRRTWREKDNANEQPVSKLVSERPKSQPRQRPGPGLGKGMITFIAPDFDAPLEDMKEYME